MKKEEREERRKASLRNSEIVMTLKISWLTGPEVHFGLFILIFDLKIE
jgi:hypothetical protein